MDDPYRGGWKCPHCEFRTYLPSWLTDHIETEHPDLEDEDDDE